MEMMLVIYFLSLQRTNSSGIRVSPRMKIILSVSFLLATAAGFVLFTLKKTLLKNGKIKYSKDLIHSFSKCTT